MLVDIYVEVAFL